MVSRIHKNKYSNSISFKIDAKELEYLFVKESQIIGSGKGLYTAIEIFKDEVICLFKGQILSSSEAKRRSGDGKDSYFINLLDGRIMDSMRVKCFAKYANDASGFVKTKHELNSKISLDENDNVCIVAIRDIKKGEEIFCSYGKAYWKNFRKRLISKKIV